jgi:hypothetical protein
MLPLLLSVALCSAQEVAPGFEPIPLQEPLPLRGDPWDLEVLAYTLPPQDVSWLESTDAFRSCTLRGTMGPDGALSWELGDCPQAMGPAALAATQAWRLAPAPDAEPTGSTALEIRYVVRYADALATMTTHAAIDPGAAAAFDGWVGVPGIKLVHPPQISGIKRPKLPKASRKAGIEPPLCSVRVELDPTAAPLEVRVLDCPEGLVEAAAKAARKARYTPLVVDGMTEAGSLELTVAFR